MSDAHWRNSIPGTSPLALRRSREFWIQKALQSAAHEEAEILIFTGDILDVPAFLTDGVSHGFQAPEDVAGWLQAIRDDYLAVRGLLDAAGMPYRILPGNHDHEAIFAEVFHDQEEEFYLGGYRWVTFTDWEQEANTPRRLDRSRRLFDRVLTDGNPAPQIHLQHYPLQPSSRTDYPFTYAEAEWMRKSIAASGRVRLVLSGHDHKGSPLRDDCGTIYSVVSALSDAPHQWQLLEISPDDRVSRETYSLGSAAPARVVFLDRDGVINDLASYGGGVELMRLIPGSGRAIQRLNRAGIRVVVVTSQSAIGSGHVTDAVVKMVHEVMHRLLANEGAFVDAIYYTAGAGPHSILPGTETWPTEKSTLIEQALTELSLQREGAWIIGDRITDIEAGQQAGIPGILVRTGDGTRQQIPTHLRPPIVNDLAAAVALIVK